MKTELIKARIAELRKQAEKFYAESKHLSDVGCCAELDGCDIASTWWTAASSLESAAEDLEEELNVTKD